MPEFESYPPGTPSWVDLASPDVDASVRFYGEIFGWDAQEAGPVEETGGYRFFTLRGRQVAGVGPVMQEGQPPAWTTYIGSGDADAAAKQATDAGGQILAAPFDVVDAGRMTILADPPGAAFGVWQPGRHKGAQLANEPGAFTWNELYSRDIDAAVAFYRAVFGWEPDPVEYQGISYTMFKLGDKPVAGGMQMGDGFPPEAPSSWAVYFAVADCDATVAKVRDLGGRVRMGPTTMSAGRLASLVDPQGAGFAVIDASTTG